MTNSCKEFVLDDVMAITAIPIENITSYSIHSPANNLTKLIAGNGFNPSYLNAITIGMQPAVAGGSLIPIKRFTGKKSMTARRKCGICCSRWNEQTDTYCLLSGITHGRSCRQRKTLICATLTGMGQRLRLCSAFRT